MQISAIIQDDTHVADGLRKIEMRGLKRIVVVAGSNGSGKTRLLHRVEQGGKVATRANRFAEGFEYSGPSGELKDINMMPIRFISTQPNLADSMNMTPASVLASAKTATLLYQKNDFANVALPYVKHVQDKWWNSRHPDSKIEAKVAKGNLQSYENLVSLITACLGEELDRDSNSNEPTLFGRTIVEASLSDGQRRLFLWAVDLHARGAKIDNRILILDEPETHLHGEALIATVDRIIAANHGGQIWIATHSVPLIASIYKNHIEDLSFYCMRNGETDYSVESPEIVLSSLLGGEANIRALREFVDLPDVFANNRFAAQCLCDIPDVVLNSKGDDPQIQIAAKDLLEDGETRKMLDFGCGKGRLLASLSAILGEKLADRINYVAWDQTDENRNACESAISTVYGSSEGRWFSDRNLLRQAHVAGSFDKIILANVLHEIEPAKWVSLFDDTSVINQSLSENGNVLFIEDYLMPKGEKAHQVGFIVLDTEAMQKLFKDKTAAIKVHTSRSGRIKGHVVPKELLKNIETDSIREALEISNRIARERISEIRQMGEPDFKAGRAHGFWVQQFANTALALP